MCRSVAPPWRIANLCRHLEFSAQTLSVLAALCEEPSQWRHGYALARQTGLKSGTAAVRGTVVGVVP